MKLLCTEDPCKGGLDFERLACTSLPRRPIEADRGLPGKTSLHTGSSATVTPLSNSPSCVPKLVPTGCTVSGWHSLTALAPPRNRTCKTPRGSGMATIGFGSGVSSVGSCFQLGKVPEGPKCWCFGYVCHVENCITTRNTLDKGLPVALGGWSVCHR